tara:strand:+ start:305 stop:448 length:144 start_codon:yes stop_codon:yes gene_type:complete
VAGILVVAGGFRAGFCVGESIQSLVKLATQVAGTLGFGFRLFSFVVG